MSLVEMLFLGGVIAGFVSFAIALAWVAHVDYKRPNPMPGDE